MPNARSRCRPDSAGRAQQSCQLLRTMGRRDDAIAQYDDGAQDRPALFFAALHCCVALRGGRD